MTPDNRRQSRRWGFSNAALIGMLALLALAGALSLVQSGQLDLGAMLATPAPAASQSKPGKKGKPPVLFPRAAFSAPAREPAEPAPARFQPRRELYQAMARMDGKAAAEVLAELEADQVTEILLQLRERDLARILEAASPLDAARWVADLLEAAPQLDLSSAIPSPALDTAGADDLSGMEPAAPAPGGAGEPGNGAEADSAQAEDDQSAAPEDPADTPTDSGTAGNTEVPLIPPDTNTA